MSYTVTFGRNNLSADVRYLPEMRCNECTLDLVFSSECYTTAAMTALVGDKSLREDAPKLHQIAVIADDQREYSPPLSGDDSDEEVLFEARENNDLAERFRRRRPRDVDEEERGNQRSLLGRLRKKDLPPSQSNEARSLSCATIIRRLFLVNFEQSLLTAPVARVVPNKVVYFGVISGALNISLIAFIALGMTTPALAISSSYLLVATTVMVISNQILGTQHFRSRAAKLVGKSLFGGAFNLLDVTLKQIRAKKAIKEVTPKIQSHLNEVEGSWDAKKATLFEKFPIGSEDPHTHHVALCLKQYDQILSGNNP